MHILTIWKKNLLSSSISSTCPNSMVNFGPLAAEIGPVVWSTPANLIGFHVLAALLHSIPVVGVSPNLRLWTEGATYIRQRGHHGHWPTFLVSITLCLLQWLLVLESQCRGRSMQTEAGNEQLYALLLWLLRCLLQLHRSRSSADYLPGDSDASVG